MLLPWNQWFWNHFPNPAIEEELFYVINALKACNFKAYANLVTMGECLGTVLHPDVESSTEKINQFHCQG